MKLLKDAAITFAFALLGLLAWKTMLVEDMAEVQAQEAQAHVIGLARTGQAWMVEQRVYTKAASKASAIALANAARALEHLDGAVVNADARSAVTFKKADKSFEHLTTAVDETQKSVNGLVGKGGEAVEAMRAEVKPTASQVQAELRDLDAATRALTELEVELKPAVGEVNASMHNVTESTKSIELALEPLRKAEGKFKAVAKWLLGLVHYNL